MKRILLSLLASVLLLSCDRENNKEVVKEELTKNNVSFVNYRKIIENNPRLKASLLKQQNRKYSDISEFSAVEGGGVGFEFILGRKSRDCFGFGVCAVSAFWIDIYSTKQDNLNENAFSGIITKTDNIIIDRDDTNEYSAFLFLANEVDSNRYDTDFIIDEDVRANSKFIIKKGVYHLNEKLGKFGGYKLDVVKL